MSIVFGCIVPHPPVLIPEIGGPDADVVSKSRASLRSLSQQLAAAAPQVAVLVSPHGESRADAMGVVAARSAGDLRVWGARQLAFQHDNDPDLPAAIHDEAGRAAIPCHVLHGPSYLLDHGSLVPLYFLRQALEGVDLVPLTFSALPVAVHYAYGQAIQRAAERSGKRVAFIASGDLSHRLLPGAPAGFDPLGKVFDEQLVQLLERRDVNGIVKLDPALVARAGQCGLNSIVMLLGAVAGLRWTPEILSYEGPFGVGYLVASLKVEEATQSAEEEASARIGQSPAALPRSKAGIDFLLRLARETVEQYVRYRTLPRLIELSPALRERAGTFVSIHAGNDLRGCIGTIDPTRENVAEETIANAVNSATRDPRFPPIRPNELPLLSYSVDVLGKPEPVSSTQELDPRRYGVIVESGRRHGLLLPDLHGVDTAAQQIEIARSKAGIPADAPVTLYRFEVRRFSEG